MSPELVAQWMGLGAETSRAELMKTLLASHPQGALLTQLLERAASAAAEDETEHDADDEELFLVPAIRMEDLEGPLDIDCLSNEDARRVPPRAVQVARLTAQVRALTERCAILAGALGACGCFGDLDDCPECRGRGRSGWRMPDREAFAVYVAPLLRRLRSASRKPDSTEHDSTAKPPKGNIR